MDGDYSANRLIIYAKDDPRYAGIIEDDTFPLNLTNVNTSPAYKRLYVYVRIFYDTGCGQAWQDTNLQAMP